MNLPPNYNVFCRVGNHGASLISHKNTQNAHGTSHQVIVRFSYPCTVRICTQNVHGTFNKLTVRFLYPCAVRISTREHFSTNPASLTALAHMFTKRGFASLIPSINLICSAGNYCASLILLYSADMLTKRAWKPIQVTVRLSYPCTFFSNLGVSDTSIVYHLSKSQCK